MVVADMQQAAGRGILGDARQLQEHLLHRLVGTPWQIQDRIVADRVGVRADGRKDIAAGLIEHRIFCS